MIQLILYILAGVLLFGAATLLLLPPRAAGGNSRLPVTTDFFPVHCRYFPQVRQTLSSDDSAFLAGRASVAVYRRWRKGRRRAGRMYLGGLREDFARLNRLARHLSVLSPKVRARQEAELLLLNLRFQLLYGMVVFRILLGQSAAEDLGQLAALIGGLGSRLEQAALAFDLPEGAITP